MSTDLERGKVFDDAFVRKATAMIRPTFTEDLRRLITGRKKWLKSSIVTETLSKLFTATAGVVSFTSAAEFTKTNAEVLSFVAGTMAAVGLLCSTFASYSRQMAISRTESLNALLKEIGVSGSVLVPAKKTQARAKGAKAKGPTPAAGKSKKKSER
jgi:hypothetical protein